MAQTVQNHSFIGFVCTGQKMALVMDKLPNFCPASFVKSLLHNQLTSKIIKVFMDQDIYDKQFGRRRALEKHALSHIKEEIAKGE